MAVVVDAIHDKVIAFYDNYQFIPFPEWALRLYFANENNIIIVLLNHRDAEDAEGREERN